MVDGAKLSEQGLRYARVILESGLAYLRRLGAVSFFVEAMEGRTLASVVTMSDAVSLSVVPAWPMGMQTRSIRSQYRHSVVIKETYLSVFFLSFLWQSRSLPKPISKRIRGQSLRLKESTPVNGSAGTHRA